MAKVHHTPSEVEAVDGEVLMDGPDGVAVSLSPEAAAETSARLLQGASQAASQRDAQVQAPEEPSTEF